MDDSDLSNIESRLSELESENSNLRFEVEQLSDQLDRVNSFCQAMWLQTDDGRAYQNLSDTWGTFLSLRHITERQRKEHATKIALEAGVAKPDLNDYMKQEKNLIKRVLDRDKIRDRFDKDYACWKEIYNRAIKPLPHASHFVAGGAKLVRMVEEAYQDAHSAFEDGDFVTAGRVARQNLPAIVYLVDTEVPTELPGVQEWLNQRKATSD